MIVIPMAGLSRRFAEAGYGRPKYALPLHGRPVFDHAVASFARYFDELPFLFVARDDGDAGPFITARARALGIRDLRLCLLDRPTEGQAATVALGLDRVGVEDDAPVTIFNIDTFRPGFAFPADAWFACSDGYLEVFRGAGANWSFVEPQVGAMTPLAARTAEKQPISDLCCTGLYHFRAASLFREALAAERPSPSTNELYVAPIYNHLIARGRPIHYQLIDGPAAIFCGVPAEYEALRDARPI